MLVHTLFNGATSAGCGSTHESIVVFIFSTPRHMLFKHPPFRVNVHPPPSRPIHLRAHFYTLPWLPAGSGGRGSSSSGNSRCSGIWRRVQTSYKACPHAHTFTRGTAALRQLHRNSSSCCCYVAIAFVPLQLKSWLTDSERVDSVKRAS